MKFSNRTDWELEENDFACLVRKARDRGEVLLDLTSSNPTTCGFRYDDNLLVPLAEDKAFSYAPEPLGMLAAREAVTAYYRDCGADVSVDRVCLTTSTSEAYSFLFRLLCDPGDEVLVATPSYPLFDYIARLDNVQLVEYPLLYDEGWLIDFHSLEKAIGLRTRAVIVVHPNNPTGHFCRKTERDALRRICSERGLALIVDEVFLDYPLVGRRGATFTAEPSSTLTFVLSGISKICGLPQMKCSWIAACGTPSEVRLTMSRLDIIADTFLSMNAPIQHALPPWLAGRGEIHEQIRERMMRNLEMLKEMLDGTHSSRLEMDAGWTCILRVPRTIQGIPYAEAALSAGVLVQPGKFYGLPEGRAVISLLTPPDVWDAGVETLSGM